MGARVDLSSPISGRISTEDHMNDDWRIGDFVAYEVPFDNSWDKEKVLKNIGGASVSFIVRTQFNRLCMLKRALESIVLQDLLGKDIEILVIVVYSKEFSPREFLEKYGSILERSATGRNVSFKYVPCEDGHRSNLLNAGLSLSEGEFVGILDDDDYLYPSHVATLVGVLRASSVQAAYSAADVIFVEEAGDTALELQSGSVHYALWWSVEKLQYRNTFPIQSVLLRKTSIGDLQFNVRLDAMEDWLFWLQFSMRNSLVGVPRRTSAYRTPKPGSAFWSERVRHHGRYQDSFDAARFDILGTVPAPLEVSSLRYMGGNI
ncbi:hypothetical protein CYK37_00045 [Mesorhizobium loti]|nr:hypothetical protein CYK37_00045 [Mesorhizobium loti]